MNPRLANFIIRAALNTPYFHLPGYMDRFWIVPFAKTKYPGADGCGLLNWRHYPIKWILQRLRVAVRVHHILRSDHDRAFHDHPWPYVTVILKGGYTEIAPVYDASGLYIGNKRTWYGPGSILFRRAKSQHRLELWEVETCWTLFITFGKAQAWGFFPNPHYKIRWQDYLQQQDTAG